MTDLFDAKGLAATNPAVNAKQLEEVAKIRRGMEEVGSDKPAGYHIDPTLGAKLKQPITGRLAATRMSKVVN